MKDQVTLVECGLDRELNQQLIDAGLTHKDENCDTPFVSMKTFEIIGEWHDQGQQWDLLKRLQEEVLVATPPEPPEPPAELLGEMGEQYVQNLQDIKADEAPKTPPIDRFEEKHSFLSNFFRHVTKIKYNYEEWPTAEHAFQAAKASKPAERLAVLQCKTPADAKKRGRRVKLRIGWDDAKQKIMLDIIRAKFSHPQLRGLLLATGDAELIEGNSHNDTYWGVCKGVGENHLGKILMRVRTELEAAEEVLSEPAKTWRQQLRENDEKDKE